MRWKSDFTHDFLAMSKKLQKKYRSFMDDFERFKDNLLNNPFQGTEFTPGIRKIRMTIESKGGGKSRGARVITLTYHISEEDGIVVFLLVYDHNQADTVDSKAIKKICKLLGYDLDVLENEGKLKMHIGKNNN